MRNTDPSRTHRLGPPRRVVLTAVAGLFTFAGACDSGGSSPTPPGGAGGVMGSGGSPGTTGSGGAPGRGGAPGSGGALGSGGAPGSGGGGGPAGSGGATVATDGGNPCEMRTMVTVASHEIVNVTWPAGPATLAGTGQVHLWGKMALTANGNMLSGSSQACGMLLPATDLHQAIGGGKILIEVPDTVWDASSASRVSITGTQNGWGVGSTVTYSYRAVVGFSEADPIATAAQWPASYSAITMTTDFDADGHPGLTGVPRNATGYLLPPASALGAISASPRADKLYLVNRQVATTTLTRTSCDEASGTTKFMSFDNHVVGCHVSSGAECTPTEVKFIDDNRTVYTVTSATTESKVVANDATCAQIRAALPM